MCSDPGEDGRRQVDFLERYEMKTLGDWKKVLDELSENALMIAKKYGLTTGTEGENCVICGGFPVAVL